MSLTRREWNYQWVHSSRTTLLGLAGHPDFVRDSISDFGGSGDAGHHSVQRESGQNDCLAENVYRSLCRSPSTKGKPGSAARVRPVSNIIHQREGYTNVLDRATRNG